MARKVKKARVESSPALANSSWIFKALIGLFIPALAYFYFSDPSVRVATLGDRHSEPIPIAFGNQILPFTLTTISRYSIQISELRVSYNPDEVTLLPNSKYRTEIAPADDAGTVQSVIFREPLTIAKDSGILSVVRYVAKESERPFHLRFVVRAKISDFDIGFLNHFLPTREWRLTWDRHFVPSGIPRIVSAEASGDYNIDTRLLGSQCKKIGEAIEVQFSPDVCARVDPPQLDEGLYFNSTGRTIQAGETVIVDPRTKKMTLPGQ